MHTCAHKDAHTRTRTHGHPHTQAHTNDGHSPAALPQFARIHRQDLCKAHVSGCLELQARQPHPWEKQRLLFAGVKISRPDLSVRTHSRTHARSHAYAHDTSTRTRNRARARAQTLRLRLGSGARSGLVGQDPWDEVLERGPSKSPSAHAVPLVCVVSVCMCVCIVYSVRVCLNVTPPNLLQRTQCPWFV